MTNTNPKAIDPGALSKVSGSQQVEGTQGNDFIQTGNEADLVFGQGGHDLIITQGGDDQVQAGDGSDEVNAGSGNDLVFGQGGNDVLYGQAGQDQLQGGEGNDILDGGAGGDQLFGQDGNDIIDGGNRDGAADYVEGGAGDDIYVWAPGNGNDTFQGGSGQDMIALTNVTQHQLSQGLNLWTGGLTMHVDHQGYVTFTNASGQPASFSGQLTIGGETLTFQDVEKLKIGV